MTKQIQVQFNQLGEYVGKHYSYHTDLDFKPLDRAIVFTDDYYVVLVTGVKPSELATEWVTQKVDTTQNELFGDRTL